MPGVAACNALTGRLMRTVGITPPSLCKNAEPNEHKPLRQCIAKDTSVFRASAHGERAECWLAAGLCSAPENTLVARDLPRGPASLPNRNVRVRVEHRRRHITVDRRIWLCNSLTC
jgi:hypothetical protein